MQFKEDFSSGLFSIGERGSKAPWFYYRNGDFIGRDPRALISITRKGLFLNIPQFTLTTVGPDDHIKLLFWRNEGDVETGLLGTPAPEKGELVYEARARAEPQGTENNPFSVPADDYRLSCGGLVSTDLLTHTGCHFLFTATRAFVVYERYLFGEREKDPAVFFMYVIPALEFPAGTEHTYRIAFSRELNAARWIIDGTMVFSLRNLGMRGGADLEQYSVFRDHPAAVGTPGQPYVTPDRRLLGAGIFTFLDADSRTGHGLAEIESPDTGKEKKIFGQGGKLILSEIEIGKQ